MHEQGSQAWLDERKDKLTASTIAVLEDKHGFITKDQFVRQKVRDLCGYENEFEIVPAIAHGHRMEPVARDYLEYLKGYEIEETGLVVHPEYPFLAASPDGLVGLSGCIEIKCPYPQYTKTPYSIFDEKKAMYLWQVYLQMECLDVDWCDFICYLAEGEMSTPKINVERVDRVKGWLLETVPGKLLPVPSSGTVQRVSLYEAWYDHIKTIAADEELREQYIKPAQDDVMKVKPTKEMEELSFLQRRLAELQDTYRDDLEEIDAIKKKSDALKKSIADHYNCSVTDGLVTVQLINRTPTIDYRKAYEYLGGDQAVLDRGGSPESFRRENNNRQINIKYGAL